MTPFRWVLLFVAVVVAMVVASFSAEPDDWSQNVEWARTRRAAWQVLATGCPVLVGEATVAEPGPALARARAGAGSVDGQAQERLRTLREQRGAPGPDDEALLARLQPAVADLHQAAQATGRPPAPAPTIDWCDLAVTVDAALVSARLPEVLPDAAVGHVLAVMAVGADLAADWQPVQQMFGMQFVGWAVEACDDAWLERLSAAQLTTLAKALAAVDDALPITGDLPAAFAGQMVEYLADGGPVRAWDVGLSSPLLAWRHGFSLRRFGMALAQELVATVQDFERAAPADEAWPARRARLAALAARDRAAHGNMMFPPLAPALDCEETRRRTCARLRLLRLAVEARAGRALPVLADPLGGGTLAVEAGLPPVARTADPQLWRALPAGR